MTYVLNLKPETARRLEERARAQGIAPEEVVEQLMEMPESETARREKLAQLTRELFDERRSAYEALAEGAK